MTISKMNLSRSINNKFQKEFWRNKIFINSFFPCEWIDILRYFEFMLCKHKWWLENIILSLISVLIFFAMHGNISWNNVCHVRKTPFKNFTKINDILVKTLNYLILFQNHTVKTKSKKCISVTVKNQFILFITSQKYQWPLIQVST